MSHKVRIGVLMGGKSLEREVSLNSGRTICDHLDTARYDVVPLFQTVDNILYILPWHFLHRGKISDFEHRLPTEASVLSWDALKNSIDLLCSALHGRYGEDGTLQGLLEVLKIPYVGSKVFASALGMDKIAQKYFLKSAGIATSHFMIATEHEIKLFQKSPALLIQKFYDSGLRFPCIVKPHKEGSSLGISVVKEEGQLLLALEKACSINPFKAQSVIIEEYIEGMEFSCIIIADKNKKMMPLSVTEIVKESFSDFYDYEQKYMPGRATKFTPARCSKEQQERIKAMCQKVMELFEITTIARIDGFLTPDDHILITEPNTFAGMAPSSFTFLQAAEHNMSHTHLINHLIETELHYYGINLSFHEQNHETTMNNKLRIGVLLGGNSNEKEISLESGRNVIYKLSPHKYKPIPLFVSSKLELYKIDQKLLVRNTTREIEAELDKAEHIPWNSLKQEVDFVFIGLHGGAGENGSIQGTLEMLEIPYNGSGVLTSALCIDKYKTAQFLKSHGFDVPHSILLPLSQLELLTEEFLGQANLTFPLIVKPHDDGCSVLVHKVFTVAELMQAGHALQAAGKEYALIEECIEGMELTVGVLGNQDPRALIPSQAVAQKGILSIEEKFLPGAGENQTPAPLPSQTLAWVQEIITHVFKTINGRGYARIDCFYQTAQQSPTGKEKLVILEINTLPGLTPATCIFHQAAEMGIKPMDFIDTIIELGFEEHANIKSRPVEQLLHEIPTI